MRRSAAVLVVAASVGLSACGADDSTPAPLSGVTMVSAKPRSDAATVRLHAAVASGDLDEARQAVADGADLESRGYEGRTPVVAATKNRDADIAIALLDAGADPDAKDDIEDSAFLYAGAEGFDAILRATLRHGADVTSLNRYGGTALIPAAEHGHASTVAILIAAGTPLDVVNESGWTALLEAVVLGNGDAAHVDTVRQLLDAGADVSIGDFDGVTPRQHAVARGQTAVVAEFDRVRP